VKYVAGLQKLLKAMKYRHYMLYDKLAQSLLTKLHVIKIETALKEA
jgi:stress-induced morphogen